VRFKEGKGKNVAIYFKGSNVLLRGNDWTGGGGRKKESGFDVVWQRKGLLPTYLQLKPYKKNGRYKVKIGPTDICRGDQKGDLPLRTTGSGEYGNPCKLVEGESAA